MCVGGRFVDGALFRLITLGSAFFAPAVRRGFAVIGPPRVVCPVPPTLRGCPLSIGDLRRVGREAVVRHCQPPSCIPVGRAGLWCCGEDDLIVDFLKTFRVSPLVAMCRVALPHSGFERRHWLGAQLFGWHRRSARTTAEAGLLRAPAPRCGPCGSRLYRGTCGCRLSSRNA